MNVIYYTLCFEKDNSVSKKEKISIVIEDMIR